MEEEYLLILDYSTGSIHLIEETPEERAESDKSGLSDEFLSTLGTKYGFNPEHSTSIILDHLDTEIAKNGTSIKRHDIDETIYEL